MYAVRAATEVFTLFITLVQLVNGQQYDTWTRDSRLGKIVIMSGKTITTKIPQYELFMNALYGKSNSYVSNGYEPYGVNPYLAEKTKKHAYDAYNTGKTQKLILQNSSDPEIVSTFLEPDSENTKRSFIDSPEKGMRISSYQMSNYPYSNVVRLSAGCTGTLLTPYHVLSAAHCVHDGKNFKENVEMIKIEVPDKIGYRIHYIVQINVPVAWLKTQDLPEAGRGAYDFAILKLNLPVSRRDKFMQLTIPDRRFLETHISFLGIRSDSLSISMVRSTCSVDDALVVMAGNVMLSECESEAGNSGAAVFTENSRTGQKIVGVLSNVISTSPLSTHYLSSPVPSQYSSIMLLTLQKCLDICAMIYPEGERYGTCTIVSRYNMEAFLAGTKRIMPFFG